nr:hypothetical protein CFP56_75322 [Quercus suber]
MIRGLEGLMTIQRTRDVHDAPKPTFTLNNFASPSASQINPDDDMLNPLEGGSMEATLIATSLLRMSTILLEDGEHAAEDTPTFEEQLYELDKEINYSPGSSKLNPVSPRLPSVADPNFSHASSLVDVSTPVHVPEQITNLIRHKVGSEMDLLETTRANLPSVVNSIFSHASSSVDMSMPPLHVIKQNSDFIGQEVEREMDSLKTTQIDVFKVGWTSIQKEKKDTRGRPKKSVQEVLLNDATLTLSSPSKSIQPTRSSKRTWKRVAVKTLNSSEIKDGSADLGEKWKVAKTESEEGCTITEEKKQKLEVSLTTQKAEVAQQPR